MVLKEWNTIYDIVQYLESNNLFITRETIRTYINNHLESEYKQVKKLKFRKRYQVNKKGVELILEHFINKKYFKAKKRNIRK